ncbi:MAG TPA: YadA-like family protein, partial [Candidatus Megamonas gallistercoris]|nr:YadA-like family protein [Candidatus Megamonas gallistercoris]
LGNGTVTTTTDKAEFNEAGATFTNTTENKTYDSWFDFNPETTVETSSTNIKGGTVTISSSARDDGKDIVIDGTVGEMSGLSNTTWSADFADQVANSEELQSVAATQGQLQSAIQQAGESATKSDFYLQNGTTNLGTDSEGNQITVSGQTTGYKADENGNIDMTVANENGEEKHVVLTDIASKTALDSVTETVNAGWTATAGGNSIAVNPKDGTSLNFVGDENITVTANATDRQIEVGLNDYIQLGDNNGLTFDGDNGTINAVNSITVGDTTGTQYVTVGSQYITGLANVDWAPNGNYQGSEDGTKAATQSQLDMLYDSVVSYDVDENGKINYGAITLGNGQVDDYSSTTHSGGTHIYNVGYANSLEALGGDVNKFGGQAVNVDYLNDTIKNSASSGEIAENEKHLATNAGVNPDNKDSYKPDTNGNITIDEVNGNGEKTGNSVVINDVASKSELDKVKGQVEQNTSNIGDMDFSDTNYIKGDTNLTDAVVDLDGAIKDTNDRIDGLDDKIDGVSNNSIAGGKINEDTGKIDLIKNDGTPVTMEGQLSNSILDTVDDSKLQSDGKITLTSHDKYTDEETSQVTLKDVASKTNLDNLTGTVGASTTEELKESYKDTTYINEAGSMVDADVALDSAIRQEANASYNRDMYLNERINNVENRLGDVEERIDKVGAMAAAIANLRTMGYDPEAPTEIAVGVGQYKSETGLALGIFHYPNQDFMLSASISTSGDEVMGGIGATWKLGRKSAEERAKDEEERILAKAEEIKQAAKHAEVKAQADRHAQLLAEREAAGQPIRPVEEA